METKTISNDLQQYFDIVSATIDFRTETFEGNQAFKGYNPIEDYYKQEKTAAAIIILVEISKCLKSNLRN